MRTKFCNQFEKHETEEIKRLIGEIDNRYDEFKYDKVEAVKTAIKELRDFDSSGFESRFLSGVPLRNIGVNSKDCDGNKIQVVYVSYTGAEDSSMADVRLIYENSKYKETGEVGFSMWHPDTVIEQIKNWGVESNCEEL